MKEAPSEYKWEVIQHSEKAERLSPLSIESWGGQLDVQVVVTWRPLSNFIHSWFLVRSSCELTVILRGMEKCLPHATWAGFVVVVVVFELFVNTATYKGKTILEVQGACCQNTRSLQALQDTAPSYDSKCH